MKTSLIAVDMDGTCVDKYKRVPQKNLWALNQALESGIIVVPATGRPLMGCPTAVKNLPGVRYVISSNGARITDLKTGQSIAQTLIPAPQAAAVLEDLKKWTLWSTLQVENRCIDNNLIPYIWRRLLYHGDFRDSLLRFHGAGRFGHGGEGVEKIQLFYSDRNTRNRITEYLKRNQPELSCALSHSNYVEITAGEASKGAALKTLCESLGIPPEQVMALGDSDNDISMLRFAGQSVAMGNADERTKAAASYVTAANQKCGVALAVMAAVRSVKFQ